ncbi:hypothetical protein BFP72_07540 [Reichenbachiella sp. 5M10]|uniref:DUF4168 domain-containing protein n=1 Tax=Reichenbachiella sp. 5M10 TaxID=1889772 RepID=UPI000C15EF4A|nr:DUF4168 domain-containing protein [Reichenbachiella sp. 5M10]PIB35259.1 hypothetical protein BFP72_07540 [Reichenbachiella sp. 5M10]
MNFKTILVATVLFASVFVAQAQEEITTEELTQYAKVMVAIDSMKAELKDKTNEMVKNDPLMDGGRRFNAIKKAGDDVDQLAALKVTDEEMTAYNDIQAKIEALKVGFKTAYTAAIKDDLGAGQYNKIKKALKEDETLSANYAAIVTSLKTEAAATETQEG